MFPPPLDYIDQLENGFTNSRHVKFLHLVYRSLSRVSVCRKRLNSHEAMTLDYEEALCTGRYKVIYKEIFGDLNQGIWTTLIISHCLAILYGRLESLIIPASSTSSM